MRKTSTVLVTGIAVALGALAPAGVAGKQSAKIKRPGFALTADGALVGFDAANPSRARRIGTITGLASGERLVGIDFRTSSGELYGLGDRSNLYEIAMQSARATRRSSLQTAGGAALRLEGTNFGVDFNPAVDRLRVISDAGQNLRANVDTGVTTVDRPLSYGGGRAAPRAVGAGYTNNDNDSFVEPALIPFDRPVATATKLFTIDSALDSLALQDPPNDGTLTTVGRLRARTTSRVGFDVYSYPNSQGNTASNTGYASLTRGRRARLYVVSLRTGRATRVRGGGGVFRAVEDIAIKP